MRSPPVHFAGTAGSYAALTLNTPMLLSATTSFSWAAHFFKENNDGALWGYNSGGTWANHIWIKSNKLTVQLYVGSCSVGFSSTIPLSSNQWHELALSFDYGTLTMTMWVNGQEEQQQHSGSCTNPYRAATQLALAKTSVHFLTKYID